MPAHCTLFAVLIALMLIMAITPKHREAFCDYLADNDFACPLQVREATYEIRPYQDVSSAAQEAAVKMLTTEWGAYIDDAFIRAQWPSTDVLYVMTSPEATAATVHVFACMAVDRKNFYPFMSHLIVAPDRRKKGWATIMMQLARKHAGMQGFDQVKLWCAKDMVPFYQKAGWALDDDATLSKPGDMVVMTTAT